MYVEVNGFQKLKNAKYNVRSYTTRALYICLCTVYINKICLCTVYSLLQKKELQSNTKITPGANNILD